jgi:hypothetical protein
MYCLKQRNIFYLVNMTCLLKHPLVDFTSITWRKKCTVTPIYIKTDLNFVQFTNSVIQKSGKMIKRRLAKCVISQKYANILSFKTIINAQKCFILSSIIFKIIEMLLIYWQVNETWQKLVVITLHRNLISFSIAYVNNISKNIKSYVVCLIFLFCLNILKHIINPLQENKRTEKTMLQKKVEKKCFLISIYNSSPPEFKTWICPASNLEQFIQFLSDFSNKIKNVQANLTLILVVYWW